MISRSQLDRAARALQPEGLRLGADHHHHLGGNLAGVDVLAEILEAGARAREQDGDP